MTRHLWGSFFLLSMMMSSFRIRRSTLGLQGVYTGVAATALSVWLLGTLSWSRPTHFWNQVTQSTACPHHVYVYTTTDLASDATAVDRLVAQRQEQQQSTTTSNDDMTTVVHRYNDSNHCRIDKDHPVEYQRMVDDALEAAMARAAVAAEKNG